MRIQINGGRLIDPATGLDTTGDLYIAKGRIAAIGNPPPGFRAEQSISAHNQIVCPGLVDLSARFREPGQEHKATISTEAAAALSAGITSVCYPPDTEPVIDTPAVVELIQQRAASAENIHIYPLAAFTLGLCGERLAEMQTLQAAGCVGVSNAWQPIDNSEVLRRALEYAAGYGLTVHIHAEDKYLRNRGVIHEGALSTRLGLPAIPETAETVALSRALLLIEQAGASAHFCRLSTARGVAMIAQAKQAGLPVTADVGICHLHLTEMDVDGYNSNCHLRPPLRTLRDKEALLQGLIDGSIDAICSDHQPHDADAKTAPFSQTEPGASTIELLLPLVLDLVGKEKLSLDAALASLTSRPAQIMGVAAGSLRVGAGADVIIIDTERAWTVRTDALRSAGKNTPFEGWELTGKVTHTVVGGRLVYGAYR